MEVEEVRPGCMFWQVNSGMLIFQTTWHSTNKPAAHISPRLFIRGACDGVHGPGTWPGRLLAIVGQDPSVFHVQPVTCWHLPVFRHEFGAYSLKWSVIFLKSWTSTASSVTSGRFSPFIEPDPPFCTLPSKTWTLIWVSFLSWDH